MNSSKSIVTKPNDQKKQPFSIGFSPYKNNTNKRSAVGNNIITYKNKFNSPNSFPSDDFSDFENEKKKEECNINNLPYNVSRNDSANKNEDVPVFLLKKIRIICKFS